MTAVLEETAQGIDSKRAHALFDRLVSLLEDFDKTLAEIIETQAWRGFGYETFGEAWALKGRGVQLRTAAAKAMIVYVLIDEGETDEGIARIVHGVSPSGAKRIREQKDDGVPANMATQNRTPRRIEVGPDETVVRQHTRKLDKADAHTVHVALDPGDYKRFRKAAATLALDFEFEAQIALETHFRGLSIRAERETS